MLKFIEADNLRLHSNPGVQVFSHIWVNTYFILSSYRLNYNLFYAVEDNDVHTYHEPWHTEHSVASPFILPWTYFFPIVIKNYLFNYRLQGKYIVTFHLILRIILSIAWSYEGGGLAWITENTFIRQGFPIYLLCEEDRSPHSEIHHASHFQPIWCMSSIVPSH